MSNQKVGEYKIDRAAAAVRIQGAEAKSPANAVILSGQWLSQVTLRGVQDFRNITRAVQYANDGDLLCRGLKKNHVVAMRA